MAMLEINDLTREFTRRGARFAAVDHVSFSMDQGELVAIIGRSGNGKSTLLNLIAGLLKPTSGTVEIDGRNVSKLSDKELSQLRNATLGFVTQGQTLLGNLTVLDNVILPAVLFGPAKKTVVPDDVAAPGEADAAGAADSAREQDDADMPDDELTFSAVSSDASVVTAAVTGTTLEVTGLKKGDATVQVTVTDRGGNSAENELFVSVAQEPGSQSGGATLRLYPNPATDYVNITLSGAGSGSADVVFYDSAARQVMKTTAELDASGTARIDGISGLTPGAYTVSVKQGGNTYKGTVLKR